MQASTVNGGKEAKLDGYFNDSSKFFNSLITTGGADSRKIDYFSVTLTVGFLLEEVFNFGSKPLEVCQKVFEKEQEEKPLDLAIETKEHLVSIINSNRNNFEIVGEEERNQDRGEVWGVINPGEYVAIFPHKLKKILSDEDYSPSSVLKLWKEKGWIQTQERNMTYPVRFQGRRVRMVNIYWKYFVV